MTVNTTSSKSVASAPAWTMFLTIVIRGSTTGVLTGGARTGRYQALDQPSQWRNGIIARAEVKAALGQKLRAMKADGPKPDVLTFAGNGEPTAHPDFAGIVDDVAELRDEYFPQAKISVLSNATMITRPAVRDALMKVDNNILKLDTANPAYIERMNRPTGAYDVRRIIENMKLFNGHVIVQTMFLHGTDGEESLTNTGDEYVTPWLEAVKEIKPQMVMIYTIDRETPDQKLRKATHEELDDIVKRINEAGFPATASY